MITNFNNSLDPHARSKYFPQNNKMTTLKDNYVFLSVSRGVKPFLRILYRDQVAFVKGGS